MAPYIVCFIVSCFFAGLDEYFKKKHLKIVSLLFAAAAILIPCLLAGFRDIGVGTDTTVYANPLFHTIRLHGYNLIGLLQSPYALDIEPVTLILYYVVSVFTDNIFWVLFFTELICILPVYVVIRNSEIKSSLKWIALFAFFCLFYCYSLNIMRQMMAICIIFWGSRYLRQGQTGKYLLVVLLTMFVHKTALLGFVVWLLYATCTKKKFQLKDFFVKKKKSRFNSINRSLYYNRVFLLTTYIVLSVMLLFTSKKIIQILVVFKDSFIYQLEHMNESFNLSLAPLIIMILYVIPCILFYRKLVRKNSEYRFFFFISFLSIILWQLQGISGEIYRVVLYLWFYIILAIPFFIQSFANKASRTIASLYYIVLLFLNWYYYFVICGSGQVIPYSSELLGI